jgi:large subunit ribosomal protein L4e
MSNQEERTVQIFDLKGGSIGKSTSLPAAFSARVREDIIRKAVIAQQSRRFQPQGRNLMAGKRTTAESFGVGRGISRVPRVGGHGPLSGTAAFAPGTVSGRSAFPPVVGKKTVKNINRKERRLALESAIAASASTSLVSGRGHRLNKETQLPIVVTDELEKLTKATEARKFLESLGLWNDILRVRKSRRTKTSGRRIHAVGPLLIVNDDASVRRAFGNFGGFQVVKAKDLSVEHLAPGTRPGRLAIWTESALKTVSSSTTTTAGQSKTGENE